MIINSYRYSGGGGGDFDFSGASRIFSVRKLNTTLTNAHMQLRRSSDNATFDLLWNRGAYDELEFTSWPPTSGNLKFFI